MYIIIIYRYKFHIKYNNKHTILLIIIMISNISMISNLYIYIFHMINNFYFTHIVKCHLYTIIENIEFNIYKIIKKFTQWSIPYKLISGQNMNVMSPDC